LAVELGWSDIWALLSVSGFAGGAQEKTPPVAPAGFSEICLLLPLSDPRRRGYNDAYDNDAYDGYDGGQQRGSSTDRMAFGHDGIGSGKKRVRQYRRISGEYQHLALWGYFAVVCQGWTGTLEIALVGAPSITRRLIAR